MDNEVTEVFHQLNASEYKTVGHHYAKLYWWVKVTTREAMPNITAITLSVA